MISVIIPYRDAEAWLRRCAKSLNQEGIFEFIFVNDNSKDDGELILRNVPDDRLVLLDNEHQAGVSGARNTGIEHAHGEWITFLDADDEMLPNAYKAYCGAIAEGPEADIHQLNHLGYYTEIDRTVMKYANHEGRYEIDNLPKCWFGVWNKLYRGLDTRFREGMQYGEDGLFNLECIAKHYVHCSEAVAVKHRFDNKHSLSHIKTREDVLKQVREYEDVLMSSEDSRVRLAIVNELARLWSSDTFARFWR